ncbi:transcription initiation factor TFIID subunit 1-like [Notamacropus eugenii]|uniref:transcription initiation factor TFIID subunit 1-like n=1 Tax=Notamacropus eugenii TaxID=9315 RepID=UPI003B672069
MEKEDMALLSKDSDTSSLEDSSVDSSSSDDEEEKTHKENGQEHGDPGGVSPRGSSMPTVTELWPQFRHGKTLRFLRLFESQKAPSVWEKVRRRMRRRKQQKGQCASESTRGGSQIVRPPGPEECLTDDETKMMAPVAPQTGSQLSDCSQDPPSEEVAPWRYGPAKLWYDMLDVPPHGRGFDYGFQLKEKSPEEEETTQIDQPLLKDENFLMVTQKSWEDDIIWDNRDIQGCFPDAQKVSQAGWIPCEKSRLLKTGVHDPSQPGGSIFIPESEDLVYGRWEDNIIWDAQAMPKPLYPPVLTIDEDDENLLLVNIKEPVEVESPAPEPLTQKESSKRSQVMLGCGIMGEDEAEQNPVQLKAKDPWNLSNDEFYFPQQHGLQVSFRVPIIQHSIPALKLHPRLFPTHMGVEQLRMFHRPPLRRLGRGPYPIHDSIHHIRKKAQERQQKLQASGGGHMFFMKTIRDLSGLDGHLILVEWSEENPPFLNQVGMASQIQSYYKRKIGKDPGPPACKYGNLVFCSSSPFLGKLHAGQFLQALENKLFRAPIYLHHMPDTDFLIVVTKAGYFLREVKDVFTVGQQCPLDEVPAPNSKMAKNYIHGFLQVFIYRQFWRSPHRPRRIRMEYIRKAFPRLAESSIRRRLAKCSDFHRTGMYFNWWVLKAGFRLPSEDELRVMLTPEKCCALYSMMAAQQRLKDAGYGEVSLLDTEETSDDCMCLEDEVQAAPWNTTRAFLAATKGQCLLEVRGTADPTGCGEAISYVKLKQENKTRLEGGRLMGTDADLRRLTLKKAQKLLRILGISEEEIKKLSRWEVIAAVRTLSTKELNSGTNSRDLTKFARVSQSLAAEQQRRFEQEVQTIFDLQNRVLSSTDVLSTDTDSSTSDEENKHMMDSMCRDIEDLLEGKTNPQKLKRQKEKRECRELQQLMLRRDGGAHLPEKGKTEKQDRGSATSNPVTLVIHRTYVDESGKEYVRSEIVREPAVIKAYIHVKTTKDEDSIRQFFQSDEKKRQELRKEKKRLQDRLRRIRIAKERKEQKGHLSSKKLSKPEASKLNLICGSCGSHGHIKTNKMCPKYRPPKGLAPRLRVMTQEQEEKELAKRLPQESLIKVQETKLFMKKKLFETMSEVQRETLKVRIEKRTLPRKSWSSPPQKRPSVHVDSDESLSCVRHPCQPAAPCPPSRGHSTSSSHSMMSPQVPLEKTESPSVPFIAKSPQKTLLPPVQLAQSETETLSYPKHKDWNLQNCLKQKDRNLTEPCQKRPEFMAQTQKPAIPPPKAGLVLPSHPTHPARQSQDPPTCSKPLFEDSSGHQSKRFKNPLCQSGQELTQESKVVSKQIPQNGLDTSLQRPPLDKDKQPALLWKSGTGVHQAPSQDRTPKGLTQKHQASVLYEDLQVSDTDEEDEEEEEEEVLHK